MNPEMPNNRERSLRNQLEEVDEKIALTSMLVSIGAIAPDEGAPDEVLERVREIASYPNVNDPQVAMIIGSFEHLFSKLAGSTELDDALTDAKSELSETIHQQLADEFPDTDEESAEAVFQVMSKKITDGERLLDALLSSVEERKEALRQMPGFDVYIENDGTVSADNPRISPTT